MLSNAFSEFVIEDKIEDEEDFVESTEQKTAKKASFSRSKKSKDAEPERLSRPKKDDPYAAFDEILAKSSGKAKANLEKLSDSNKVACVAMFSKNDEARKSAVEIVGDNPELLSIICAESQYKDSAKLALDKLTELENKLENPRSLATLACNCNDKKKRLESVRKIKEISALLDVAYGSRFEDSRWEAISMLKEMGIDIDDSDLKHDETLVGSMRRLIKSSATQEEIVNEMGTLLDNVSYLQTLYESGKHHEFRDVVHDNIESYNSMIKNIAISSKYEEARQLALKGLSENESCLMEIAQHSEYEETAESAISSLSSKLDKIRDSQIRALIASLGPNSQKRARALEKIDDEAMLRHVIQHTKYDGMKYAAAARLAMMIDRLNDPESLRLVLAFCTDPKKRQIAEKRIKELGQKKQVIPPKKKKAMEEIKKPEDPWAAPPLEQLDDFEEQPLPMPRRKGGGFWNTIKDLIGL